MISRAEAFYLATCKMSGVLMPPSFESRPKAYREQCEQAAEEYEHLRVQLPDDVEALVHEIERRLADDFDSPKREVAELARVAHASRKDASDLIAIVREQEARVVRWKQAHAEWAKKGTDVAQELYARTISAEGERAKLETGLSEALDRWQEASQWTLPNYANYYRARAQMKQIKITM